MNVPRPFGGRFFASRLSSFKWFVMADLPFEILLYCYFFFSWLFRDVSHGNLLERAAAWRHNQAQARWLKTYLRRWLFLGALLYALGAVTELLLQAPVASAFFYVPMAFSMSVNTVIGVWMLGLKALSGPL